MSLSSPSLGRITQNDLDICAVEPIHVPGSIQPHGVLFATTDDLVITHVSANSAALLQIKAQKLLGQNLSDIISTDDLGVLKAALAGDLDSANPIPMTVGGSEASASFDAIIHRNGKGLIVEFEPQSFSAANFQASYHSIRTSLNRLNGSTSLLDLAQNCSEEVRRITGFDRVMIYRFDTDYNGEVIAEAKAEGVDPYLGLFYPASDIPAQARALYERNWLRIIPDATYTPSPLLSAKEFGDDPLDMTFSVLRSVSPVHCEYLGNMGVVASMSVSLISNGKLWGLIACHNFSPLQLPFATRSAAEFIGQTVSVLLAARQSDEGYEKALLVRSVQTQLLDLLAREEGEVALALTHFQPTVADVVGASGAVLCLNDEVFRVGNCPSNEDVDAISKWVWTKSDDFYATNNLSKDESRFTHLADIASGLIAVALHPNHRSWVMWFRPETLQTLTWAGNPTEKTEELAPDGSLRLGPRKSFAAWKETVANTSEEWTEYELRGAAELGRRLEAHLVRILQDEADAARTFQERLTLATFPEVNGLSFAARYKPGDGGLVGGDWYDVVPLVDGGTAITIGDVAGHGLVAAATMAQLRNGMRAYLVEEAGPSGAVGRLNRLVHWLLPNDLATTVVGVFEPQGSTLRITNAGHLPPVLVRNGVASLLHVDRSPALGISENARYGQTEVVLEAGDIVLLFTDGLVESRTESLDVGFDRLLAAAAQGGPLEELCDHLLASMKRADSSDDIAILAMKVQA